MLIVSSFFLDVLDLELDLFIYFSTNTNHVLYSHVEFIELSLSFIFVTCLYWCIGVSHHNEYLFDVNIHAHSS